MSHARWKTFQMRALKYESFFFLFLKHLACYDCLHWVRCTSAAVKAYLMKNHKMGHDMPCEHLSTIILICSQHTSFNSKTVLPCVYPLHHTCIPGVRKITEGKINCISSSSSCVPTYTFRKSQATDAFIQCASKHYDFNQSRRPCMEAKQKC